jgi:hypothetical protein
MSIITLGLDPVDSKLITMGYGTYIVEVIIREEPVSHIGGIPQAPIFGSPPIKKQYTLVLRIKEESEIEWVEEEYDLDFDRIFDFILANVKYVGSSSKDLDKIVISIKERFEVHKETRFQIAIKPILENTDGRHEDPNNGKPKVEIRLKS